MRLVSFTIVNYRSITKAYKVQFDKMAILVGPNNEGKSNILRALATAMNILTKGGRRIIVNKSVRSIRYDRHGYYDWERDFPVHLQGRKTPGKSEIELEFELTQDEIQKFRAEIKSSLNGTLPLRLKIGKEEVEVRVVKRGRGGNALSAKSTKIAEFISKRLDFEHIPAVRTASSAQRIVDDMVERELRTAEYIDEYSEALNKIAEIQKPILEKLSESIRSTLVGFLPAVKHVEVAIPPEARYKAMRRSCEITVDDGAPTLLRFKGDGVQSLAALGIMRHASEKGASGRNLVIAIEEPESHLHPCAIHELKAVINELSEKHQIVLTTHCPLFVDRLHIKSNIVVNNKKAMPANDVNSIREILGVRASDNLRNADLILLVEGEDDKVALEALLPHHSERLKKAFADNTIAIDTLSGGTNLAYKLGQLRDSLCLYHCYLDNDKCGQDSFNKAKVEGLIDYSNVNFCTCDGMLESEIEDMYNTASYSSALHNKYRVSLETPKFKSKKKWSDRLKETFKNQGKQWDGKVKSEVKLVVAENIVGDPANALNDKKRNSYDALVTALIERLDEINDSRKA